MMTLCMLHSQCYSLSLLIVCSAVLMVQTASHYTIDVLVAPFVAAGCYYLALVLPFHYGLIVWSFLFLFNRVSYV